MGSMALLVLLAVGLIYYVMQTINYYQELAENVAVSEDWTVISIDPPVEVEKQMQEIVIVVPGARVSTGRGEHFAFLPDGSKIQPDVEIADESGQWYLLTGGRFGVTDYDSNTQTMSAAGISYKVQELPQGTSFVSVRIKSEAPFTCTRIRWHAYYMK